MYRVYSDDVLIYNDLAAEQEARLIAPTVEWSDNSTGTFTFTMPTINVGYESLTLMQSKIKIYRNDELIWVGRAIKETKDFWKNRQITCEGVMGYLNDVIQPQRDLSSDEFVNTFHGYPEEYLQIILDYHNEVMRANDLDDRQIFMGRVTVTDMMKSDDPDEEYYGPDSTEISEDYVPTIYIDNKSTMECISDKLTGGKNVKGEDLEGHLRFRIEPSGFYLDYLKDPVDENPQVIEFGKNLLDFTVNYDEADFCTVLYPRGASDGTDIGNMSHHIEIDPEDNGWKTKDGMDFYVDAPRIIYMNQENNPPAGKTLFGYIEKILDFSEEQSEKVLLDKSLEWFTKNRFNDMEINLKAFDLAYLGAGEQFIRYMDSVHVRSIPHGLDKDFPVLGVSIPLDQPQNASYTLGKKKVQSLSAYSSNVDKDIKETQEYTLEKTNETYHKSETLIRNATTGVVNTMMNQYGAEGLAIIGLDPEVSYRFDEDVSKTYTCEEVQEMIHNGTITVETLPKYYNTDKLAWVPVPIWYWNMGGLAFFENGIGNDSEVAIDRLGHINCKFLYGEKIQGIDIEGTKVTTRRANWGGGIVIQTDSIQWQTGDGSFGAEAVIFSSLNWGSTVQLSPGLRIKGGGTDGGVCIGTTSHGLIVPNSSSKPILYTRSNKSLDSDSNEYQIVIKRDLDNYAKKSDIPSGSYATEDWVEMAINFAVLQTHEWVEDHFERK